MPMIKVEMFAGRTKEQKSKLVKALTQAFVDTAGGKPESVHVIIIDVDKQNWGSGGVLCSEKFTD